MLVNAAGSTLEAMALAVERSAVVLVCLSQGYKDSPSCRTGNFCAIFVLCSYLLKIPSVCAFNGFVCCGFD